MKVQADKHRSEREFQVSEMVYLKLQPYRQHSVNKRAFHKLAAKYFGPFQVLQKVRAVAYKLNLPPESKIHNVFHVSLLKKKIGLHQVHSSLPLVTEAGEFQLFPVKILDKRTVKKRNSAISEVLVQWSNTDVEDSTWEEVHKLQLQYPEFDVWASYHP
ncbi:retrotransposable element Tf2 [Tanacetum coccineum]